MEIIAWRGHCEVHERFTAEELLTYRSLNPGLKIIAHPECPPEVIDIADFTGSTSGMINWVKTNHPKKALLVTECSMASNVAAEAPETEFVRPCNLCPHMKRISLESIYESLRDMKYEISIDATIAHRARRAVERMIELKS